jgi:hypothetical protein
VPQGADIPQRCGQCYNLFWCSPRLAAHFWYAHRVCEFAVGLRTKETTQGRCGCKAPYPHGLKRNWLGVIPVQRLNALVKELTSTYPNSHAISETGRSRSAR